jgi:hypothetical protein
MEAFDRARETYETFDRSNGWKQWLEAFVGVGIVRWLFSTNRVYEIWGKSSYNNR